MNPSRRSFVSAAAGLALVLGTNSQAFAQASEAGAKPITFIVPFTAGSGTDVVARIVSDYLTRQLHRPIIVDNRAGAGGTLGASLVAAAPGDGQTVLIHSAGHVANAALYPKLKYDTLRDFTPVAMLATLPNVLVVSPAMKVNSVAELVNRAKANPNKMTYASAGNGSATHINAEKFRIAAKLEATHVPYRGTPPALTDVIGGQVDWFFAPLVSALPLIQDNKLVPLAVGSAERSPALPNVPTTVEAGYPGSDYTFWVGMFVPSKTPPDLVAALASATAKVLHMPEVKAALEKLGAEPAELTQRQFADQLAKEMASTSALVKQAGLRID
jgi:tripartite-type tricarboxylate transporter receptor subunit TctC